MTAIAEQVEQVEVEQVVPDGVNVPFPEMPEDWIEDLGEAHDDALDWWLDKDAAGILDGDSHKTTTKRCTYIRGDSFIMEQEYTVGGVDVNFICAWRTTGNVVWEEINGKLGNKLHVEKGEGDGPVYGSLEAAMVSGYKMMTRTNAEKMYRAAHKPDKANKGTGKKALKSSSANAISVVV